MLAYIARRLLLGIPTILGTLLLLFLVFFLTSTPDQIARNALSEKAKPADIKLWKQNNNYSFKDEKLEEITKKHFGDDYKKKIEEKKLDQKNVDKWQKDNMDIPNFFNKHEEGWSKISETTFWQFMTRMITFKFGDSTYDKEDIWVKIRHGIVPSLAVTTPIFIFGLVLSVFISMLAAMFRRTYIDTSVITACILGMSIVYFMYIIGIQFVMAKTLKWYPISGWADNYMIYFLTLPFIIGTIATVGESTRFYRTIMVNEINSDYIRTARAKGLGDIPILTRHLLRNAMIPILTRVILSLPFLVTGSLLLESFFGIPGLGRMTVDAITFRDLPTLSSVTYLSSIIYVLANIVSDISYTLVDPRVRLN